MPTDETTPSQLLIMEQAQSAARFMMTLPNAVELPDRASTGIWINVHADPHNGGLDGIPIEPADTMSNLLGLLDSAEAYGHRLTVLLSPPWTKHLLQDSFDRSQLDWRLKSGGHVLGFHHHDVSHTDGDGWDGYHSLSIQDCISGQILNSSWSHSYAECEGSARMTLTPAGAILSSVAVEEAFGEFEELMALLLDLHEVDPSPYERGFAASHGTGANFKDQEWQDGVVYSQVRVNALPVGVGCATDGYNGNRVLELGSIHLDVGNRTGDNVDADVLVDQLQQAVSDNVSGEYFGTTIHAWEYRETSADTQLYPDDKDTIDTFFQELVDVARIQAQPMQEYMETHQELFNCLPTTAAITFP